MRVVIDSSQKECIYFPILFVLPVPLCAQSSVSIAAVSPGNGRLLLAGPSPWALG